MIPIEKEPADLYMNTRVYEHCMFCNTQTDMWNLETNKPICKVCAPKYKVKDIPKYPHEK